MLRRQLVVLAIGCATLGLGSQPASAARSRAAATTVTVTAGKPSEFAFRLSRKTVPAGSVTFEVTNDGTLPHDFKIAGKKTKLLSPGESQTLRVRIAKAGGYAYLCTVTGHAAAGMRGTLGVTGPAAASGKGKAKAKAGATAGARTEVVIAGKPSEFRFRLSRRSVPHGTVTFEVRNEGAVPHDFRILGHKTKLLAPGRSQTIRVRLPQPGKYAYVCTVGGHAAAGMMGILRVT